MGLCVATQWLLCVLRPFEGYASILQYYIEFASLENSVFTKIEEKVRVGTAACQCTVDININLPSPFSFYSKILIIEQINQ